MIKLIDFIILDYRSASMKIFMKTPHRWYQNWIQDFNFYQQSAPKIDRGGLLEFGGGWILVDSKSGDYVSYLQRLVELVICVYLSHKYVSTWSQLTGGDKEQQWISVKQNRRDL